MVDVGYSWYIIQVIAGCEDKVVESIANMASRIGLGHEFKEMFIPCENVWNARCGKKVCVRKKLFPGYVFINMRITDETLRLVRNVSRFAGFLGGDGSPRVVPDDEIGEIKRRIETGAVSVATEIRYEPGESVRIVDGPFQSFVGKIESINEEKGMLKVFISIFGRPTRVELELNQVEKMYEE